MYIWKAHDGTLGPEQYFVVNCWGSHLCEIAANLDVGQVVE